MSIADRLAAYRGRRNLRDRPVWTDADLLDRGQRPLIDSVLRDQPAPGPGDGRTRRLRAVTR